MPKYFLYETIGTTTTQRIVRLVASTSPEWAEKDAKRTCAPQTVLYSPPPVVKSTVTRIENEDGSEVIVK